MREMILQAQMRLRQVGTFRRASWSRSLRSILDDSNSKTNQFFNCDHLCDFDGRVIYFNGTGDCLWYYGVVHFFGEDTFISVAHNELVSPKPFKPFDSQIMPTFLFRATLPAEHRGLMFVLEEL